MPNHPVRVENEDCFQDPNLIGQHAPWFKLSKYDALKNASPRIWYTQFALRIDLQRTRSLLMAQDSPLSSMHQAVHEELTALVRDRGVLRGEALKGFLTAEEFLYPETLSTFHAANRNGIYVREMTLGDHKRVAAALDSGKSEHSDIPSDEPASAHSGPSDTLNRLVRHSLLPSSEAHLTVDLRCPRALILKQVAELLDTLQRDRAAWLPVARQTKLPALEAWHRSRVLPYLDLRQWLDTNENSELRESVKDAAIADVLGIDPKQLADTTKKHAEELSDALSWTFIHLSETAVSSFRQPARRLRNARKAGSPPTK